MQAEAIDILASLIERTDESGAQAIAALVSIAREQTAAALLAGRDAAAWVEAAARHPKTSPRLRVLAWDLQLASRPADADKVIVEFLAKWREAALPERLEAARWLNQRGRPAQSLEISGPQRDTSSDWLMVHLDSLAATGRWDTVLEILESKSGQAAAMPEALRAVFALRARSELGKPQDKDEKWRDIQILLTNETVQNQLYIAQYAEKVGEPKQASLIYRRLSTGMSPGSGFTQGMSREEKLACFSGVIRHSSGTAPAAELLPVLEAMSEDFPEMDEAANDAIYLRLLTGETNERMPARLQSLLTKSPAVLAYRTTFALPNCAPATRPRRRKPTTAGRSTGPPRPIASRSCAAPCSRPPDATRTRSPSPRRSTSKKLRPEEAKAARRAPVNRSEERRQLDALAAAARSLSPFI